MSANDKQFGGTHYKNGKKEHWDMVKDLRLGYYEGNITKYITRWRRKGGLSDLDKAGHYLEKLIEVAADVERGHLFSEYALGRQVQEYVHQYAQANELKPDEEYLIFTVVTWKTKDELRHAAVELEQLKEKGRALGA